MGSLLDHFWVIWGWSQKYCFNIFKYVPAHFFNNIYHHISSHFPISAQTHPITFLQQKSYTQLLKSSSQNRILGSTFKEGLLLRSLLLRRSYFLGATDVQNLIGRALTKNWNISKKYIKWRIEKKCHNSNDFQSILDKKIAPGSSRRDLSN